MKGTFGYLFLWIWVLTHKSYNSLIILSFNIISPELSNIFNEEPDKNVIVNEGNKDIIKEILSLLFTKEQWNKEELETICKNKGLMLGSILEEINDYSYSIVDDVVLEDEGDSISVIMDYKDDLL